MISLLNKKVLLAANNSVINNVILESLLELGAAVLVIGDLKSDTSIVNPTIVNCDLSGITNLENIVQPQLDSYKPFDGFVFAGGKGGVRPLGLTKPDFLEDMMRANVFSFIELSRLITKKGFMKTGGSIVALSSVSSSKGLKSKIAYSASKAALDGAIRSMAAELAAKKIRVNSIRKGWVSSDMDLGFIQNNRVLTGHDDFQNQHLGAIEPHEIAAMVCFLLSDLSKSITGTAVLLDGGYSL